MFTLKSSSGEVVEDTAGTIEFGEAFFFGAEFAGVRNEAATGAARRMFDVKHFVEEDVLDGELRNTRAIHAAVEKNLIGTGIVAAELAAPASQAPADVRALELAFEILPV